MNGFFQRVAGPRGLKRVFIILLPAALALPVFAQSSRVVSGHVISETRQLKPVDLLPATNHLNLVLGLPLRNQPALDQLLQDLHDPVSTNYHRWLTPEQD